jgi:hypothetical protein
VNLLADMGVRPVTLQSGSPRATASAETTAPSAAIMAPSSGATIQTGGPVTTTGTASDVSGQVRGRPHAGRSDRTAHAGRSAVRPSP